MISQVVADTGPLVAILRKREKTHKTCVDAEREDVDTVFTLDRRDFSVYRTTDGRALNIGP